MPSLSIREKFIHYVITLSSHRLGNDKTTSSSEFSLQKNALRQRWHALLGIEKFLVGTCLALCILVFVQFIWIIVLSCQLYAVSEQNHMQQTRIAQLEQSVKKHNNLLYSTYTAMDDIQKKWHDLHFRVLENTWKIDK